MNTDSFLKKDAIGHCPPILYGRIVLLTYIYDQIKAPKKEISLKNQIIRNQFEEEFCTIFV